MVSSSGGKFDLKLKKVEKTILWRNATSANNVL